MIVLDATTKSLEVLLASAGALDVTSSYADVTTSAYTPGASDGATNGTTAVTAVAAPGASTQRQVKLLTVYNTTSATHALTVRLNNNSTMRILWKGLLLPGEALVYTDRAGFDVVGAARRQKPTNFAAYGTQRAVPSFEQRVLAARADRYGAHNSISSDVAFWTYIGRTSAAVVAKYVEFYVTTGGSGSQTAEIALASTPASPHKVAQIATILASDGTLGDCTGTGVKRNTSALNYTVPAGTHLWAGVRFAMGTTQPQVLALMIDMALGAVAATSASALTGLSTVSLAVPSLSQVQSGLDLRVTLD